MTSPRARNVPRENSVSLRSYCMDTSRARISWRPTRSPVRSVSTIAW
ncbi:hypothetical protein CDEN61S_03936 [Castellaniella denitrificans]